MKTILQISILAIICSLRSINCSHGKNNDNNLTRQKRGLFDDIGKAILGENDQEKSDTSISDSEDDSYYNYDTEDSEENTESKAKLDSSLNYYDYDYDYDEADSDSSSNNNNSQNQKISNFNSEEPDYYDYAYFGADYDYLDPKNNHDFNECSYAKEFPQEAKKDRRCHKYLKELTDSGYFSDKNFDNFDSGDGGTSIANFGPREPLPDPKNDIKEAGRCIMRGQCAKNGPDNPTGAKPGAPLNCRYNDKALMLEDPDIVKTYKYMCPAQYEKNGALTCCDDAQIRTMDEALQMARGILARCPICMTNFIDQICAFTCGPDQSLYLTVDEYNYSEVKEGTNEIIEPYNDNNDPNRVVLTSVNFQISSLFADSMYESCKNVQYPPINGPAVSMMCGNTPYEQCTGEKLLSFTGTMETGQTPFKIDFDFVDPSDPETTDIQKLHTWIPDHKIPSCNATASYKNDTSNFRHEIPFCSCADCEQTCPPLPDHDDPEPPFMILGIDGIQLILGAVFLVFTWLVITVAITYHFYIQQRKHEIREENRWISCIDVGYYLQQNLENDEDFYREEGGCSYYNSNVYHAENNDDDDLENTPTEATFQEKAEIYMQKIFERWGYYCACHPWTVICMSFVFVTIVSSGLINHRMTTDPVELWSSPTSTCRQQKDYFDESFGPFYRTEQVIIEVQNFDDDFRKKCVKNEVNDINPDWEEEDLEWCVDGPVFQHLEIWNRTLELQNTIEQKIEVLNHSNNITLNDLCLKPMYPDNEFCTIMSATQYIQNNADTLAEYDQTDVDDLASFRDRIQGCMKNPTNSKPGEACLSKFGAPINPSVVLGGFDTSFTNSDRALNSTVLIVTIPLPNTKDPKKLAAVKAWEEELLNTLHDIKQEWKKFDQKRDAWRREKYTEQDLDFYRAKYSLKMSFMAERSVEDELDRQSHGDILTVCLSYFIMFLYVAIALGQCTEWKTIFIDSKIVVGLVGVVIVLAAVAMSLGFWSLLGIPLSLIIIEVVPFLVLAVGVDNIFIIIQHFQREMPKDNKKDTIERQVARVIGSVGPSIFLSALCETLAFMLGALSSMPAVRTFSLFAGGAVFFDFLLQVTAFVAILTLVGLGV